MHATVVLSTSDDVAAGPGIVFSVGIAAGADDASVILKRGGSSGTVICKLVAKAGTYAQRNFTDGGVYYHDLYATIAGTSPVIDVQLA